jgi:endonuclease/exonuclease/phosphatase family metal-dependent hydrolase
MLVLPRRCAAMLVAFAACGDHHAPGSPRDSAIDSAPLRLDASAPDALDGTRVRIMAANLTSGTQQAYEDPGIRIFQGLAPDIVAIQEFNYTSGTQREFVDDAFGPDFSFYSEPQVVGGIPNGVVTRYPIVTSGVWTDASTTDRAFVYAQIDLPGPTDLWIVSVHLLTTSAAARSTETMQLLGYIDANVPADDFLVVGGDFNTDSIGEQALANLSTDVDVDPPLPDDQNGNTNTSINRNHPHDWLLVRGSAEAHEIAVTSSTTTYAAGLVFDSRVFTPLAEVAPVMATDSAATGMQHMPVVKDFVF